MLRRRDPSRACRLDIPWEFMFFSINPTEATPPNSLGYHQLLLKHAETMLGGMEPRKWPGLARSVPVRSHLRSGISCALKTKRPKESSKRWIRTSSKFLNIKLPFHWLPTWVIRSNTESVFQFLGDVIYSAKGWRTMRLASRSIPAHESRAQLIEVHTWTSHHDDSKFPHLDVAAITAAQRVWMKQLA